MELIKLQNPWIKGLKVLLLGYNKNGFGLALMHLQRTLILHTNTILWLLRNLMSIHAIIFRD